MTFPEANQLQSKLAKAGFITGINEDYIRYLDKTSGVSVASISLDMFPVIQKYTPLRNGGVLSDTESYPFIIKVGNRAGAGPLGEKIFSADVLGAQPDVVAWVDLQFGNDVAQQQ